MLPFLGQEPIAGSIELGCMKEEFLEVKLEWDESDASLNDHSTSTTTKGIYDALAGVIQQS